MRQFLKSAALISVAGGLGACFEAPAPAEKVGAPPVEVVVEPLGFEYARTRVEAVGTSRAVRSVDVYPAAAGEVVAVNFEPGQIVRAGQVLVELDRREEELAVRLAKLNLEDAERLYDRYQRSADSGAVLPTVLDAARTAVEAARLELERAKNNLDDRTIVAAFDGHVGTTDVDRGDRINPDTMVTTLDDRRALFVTFEVPEAFIGELAAGDRVELETWSSSTRAVAGQVIDIGSRVDPRKRTFVARARVVNAGDTLRPGQSFRVGLDVEGAAYPVIAETGLQWGADGAYVWFVVDGQAEQVPVKVVQRRAGRVLIDVERIDSDVVVVEGIQRMREGVRVNHQPLGLAEQRTQHNAVEATGGGSVAGSE